MELESAIRNLMATEYYNKKIYLNTLNKALERYGHNYNRGFYLKVKLSDAILSEIESHNASFDFKMKKINVVNVYPHICFVDLNKYKVELFTNRRDYLNRFMAITMDENLINVSYCGNVDDIPLVIFSRTHNTKLKRDWLLANDDIKYIIVWMKYKGRKKTINK